MVTSRWLSWRLPGGPRPFIPPTLVAGGVRKKYLAEVMHYTKDMIDNSFNHAKTQGLYRKNAVHGEEEARLVLDDTFNNKNEKGEATNLSSNGTFEDLGLVCLCLRLVFPTLQRNDSPFTILPTYIAVLGKKIDHGSTQKDAPLCYSNFMHTCVFRAAHV